MPNSFILHFKPFPKQNDQADSLVVSLKILPKFTYAWACHTTPIQNQKTMSAFFSSIYVCMQKIVLILH